MSAALVLAALVSLCIASPTLIQYGSVNYVSGQLTVRLCADRFG